MKWKTMVELPVVVEQNIGTSYDFHILMLIETEPNVFYMGTDMGCSCPAPFEDQTVKENFTRVFCEEDVVRYVDNVNGSAYDGRFKPEKFRKAFAYRVAKAKENLMSILRDQKGRW